MAEGNVWQNIILSFLSLKLIKFGGLRQMSLAVPSLIIAGILLLKGTSVCKPG